MFLRAVYVLNAESRVALRWNFCLYIHTDSTSKAGCCCSSAYCIFLEMRLTVSVRRSSHFFDVSTKRNRICIPGGPGNRTPTQRWQHGAGVYSPGSSSQRSDLLTLWGRWLLTSDAIFHYIDDRSAFLVLTTEKSASS